MVDGTTVLGVEASTKSDMKGVRGEGGVVEPDEEVDAESVV